jgi:methionine-rich copper-binding protein CopC
VTNHAAGKDAAGSNQKSRRFHIRNLTKVIALTAAFLVAAPLPAQAHAALVSSNPANKSTIQSFPSSILLTFDDPLLHLGNKEVNKLYAHTPDHELLKTGPVIVKGGVISISVLEEKPKAGTYTIYYRVISDDGHPVSGVETFNYKSASPEKEITVLQPVNFDHFWHLHKWHTVEVLAALALIISWAIYRRRNR